MNRATPPQNDEFEVSVIGPGKGECILLHIGNNEWCVIDSCVARGSKEPVAVEYLRSFNNGALQEIRVLLATHWHDDHIRGLADILRIAPNAQFFCSAAFNSEMFIELMSISQEMVPASSSMSEFSAIYEILQARKTAKTPHHLVTPGLASEKRVLFELPALGRPFDVHIISLSPSDGTIAAAHQYFKNLIPDPGGQQLTIPDQEPNLTSVALWVRVGRKNVLLGGDVLYTGNDGEGWSAIVASHAQQVSAEIFKVAHHGSETGDCPDIWSELLSANPIAVVTPFTSGVALPKPGDVKRICAYTSQAFRTVERISKPPRREVEKDIDSMVKKRRALQGNAGHVRIRWSVSSENAPWTVELFNGAASLCPQPN